MKIKLAILEHDRTYLNRLVTVFNTKYADKLEIYSFTTKDLVYEILEKNKIDVFLADDSFEIDADNIPSRCGFAYLVESADIELLHNEKVIPKFQKAELIYKQILDLFSESSFEIKGSNLQVGEGGKVIAFLSASGGTGSSTSAAACALRFAQLEKKVLYLNMEQFGSADVFFKGEGTGNFGDIIYAIKSKKGNLALKLESMVKQDESGVFFYSSTPMALDMAEITSEEIRSVIASIKACGEYDYIILDMDFSLEKSEIEVLKECHQIVLVNDGSPTSNTKLERVLTSLRILEEQNDWKILIRCSVLYNRFSSKTSEKMEMEDVKELGGIKRFEGYNVEQLIKQLADTQVFDGLL